MCLASFVDTDLASGSTFRHIIDADEMVLTKLFWNHTLANQSIIIGSGGTAFNDGTFDCQYVIVRDISIVITLCPTGCSLCLEPEVCTTCSFDTTIGKQLYFDQILGICVPTCTSNYYNEEGPPQKFICNKCHLACKTCTLMNSATDCTTCNEAAGYYLQLNSNTTCGFACLSGQVPTSTSPKRCILCDSSCLKCKYIPTNCSLCGVDSFGRMMYLSPITCSPTCGIQTSCCNVQHHLPHQILPQLFYKDMFNMPLFLPQFFWTFNYKLSQLRCFWKSVTILRPHYEYLQSYMFSKLL